MSDQSQVNDESKSFVFFRRVQEAPLLGACIHRALGFYEVHTPEIVKTSVHKVGADLLKVADPLVQRIPLPLEKYAEQLDTLGCQTLDKFESRYEQGVEAFKKVEGQVKSTTIEPLISIYSEKVLKPVGDVYHKVDESVVQPVLSVYDTLLLQANSAVESYLPEEPVAAVAAAAETTETETEKETEEAVEATKLSISQLTSTVSKRIQKRALSKLGDVKKLSEERLKEVRHNVSLIQYATEYLDQGSKTIKSSCQLGSDYVRTASPAKVVEDLKNTTQWAKNASQKTLETASNNAQFVVQQFSSSLSLTPTSFKDTRAKFDAKREELRNRLKAAIDSFTAAPLSYFVSFIPASLRTQENLFANIKTGLQMRYNYINGKYHEAESFVVQKSSEVAGYVVELGKAKEVKPVAELIEKSKQTVIEVYTKQVALAQTLARRFGISAFFQSNTDFHAEPVDPTASQ